MNPFANIGKWFEVPQSYPAENIVGEGVHKVFLEGLPYQGCPTRFFAYYNFPEGASAEKPVPGVVLVHGGGATAVAEWVKLWNSRGYAAISMDTCGAIPEDNDNPYWSQNWPRHEFSGPRGWGRYPLAFDPPEEQWMYHAVASVILSHSFLRSFPQVDCAHVGVTGISWGGVLTSLVAGLDSRFCFAIPVYGCGFFNEFFSTLIYEGNPTREQVEKWFTLWDPGLYLPQAKMPILFLSGSNDFAFPLCALQKSFDCVPSSFKRMAIRPAYPHNHTVSLEERTTIDFAAAVLARGDFPEVSKMYVKDGKAFCSIRGAGREIQSVDFLYTRATGYFPDRRWNSMVTKKRTADETSAVRSNANDVETYFVDIPPYATAFYFNLYTADGLCISSNLELDYSSGC